MSTAPSTRNLKPLLLLAMLMAGGCHLVPDMPDPMNFPGAKARNLEQLHDMEGSYRYRGILLGDFGYLIEVVSGRDRELSISPSSIGSPSRETMENLAELLESSSANPQTLNLQVEWCARLVSGDASDLVRERAVLGLGSLAAACGMRELGPPPQIKEYATPVQVGEAVEGLLRSLRLQGEAESGSKQVIAASEAAAQLTLDLDGAWRMLKIAPSMRDMAEDPQARASLDSFIARLRVELIEQGIYLSLSDESDRVRSAGLAAMVTLMGPNALAGFLSQPMPGWSDTIVLGIVDLVTEVGLPDDRIPARTRGLCLSSLLRWAQSHPSPRVRVRSMLALNRIAPGGPGSLREEDWSDWERITNSTGAESS